MRRNPEPTASGRDTITPTPPFFVHAVARGARTSIDIHPPGGYSDLFAAMRQARTTSLAPVGYQWVSVADAAGNTLRVYEQGRRWEDAAGRPWQHDPEA